MSEALEDRIRRGELEAFDDPELPLRLLAEPWPLWLATGLQMLAHTALMQASSPWALPATLAQRTQLKQAVQAWVAPLRPSDPARGETLDASLEKLRSGSEVDVQQVLRGLTSALVIGSDGRLEAWRVHTSLTRLLLTVSMPPSPWTPPKIDPRALRVLAHYGGL